ncbi:M28 family metallopeptidase [Ornithinicoccus halotolerans]|uniref:M28 family metallopeptidase n=1 Tax=Ornithinicoccus halotolerans TaxID=1748220 RepID=UPI00129817FC|nr:M28 family metallopeptidase [Ornithinicoccus halotolerans]
MPFSLFPSRRLVAGGATAALVGLGLAAAPSGAAPSGQACDNRTNNTYAKLLECVRLEGVMEHQEAFQAIADANGGTRADQTPGYEASVDYVVDVLQEAGWDAEVVEFGYPGVDNLLHQLTPTDQTHAVGTRVTGTGEGDVTGEVIPVDLSLADPAASTSGCEATDFAGLNLSGSSDVALIQRGACAFQDKVQNAVDAGAEAVVIFNTGTPGNEGLLDNITLGIDFDIPVVATSHDSGVGLSETGSTARVMVDFVTRTSYNVIGELAGDNPDNVVMAGAHLDSVMAGPGINDNGSGSSALLEIAQVMGKLRPENTVRFAWWGAEELGLIGSTEWVGQQSQEELDRIALYLNFDMIGSPNYVFQVYDANESSFEAPVPVPEGSEAIESLFESFYTLRGEPYDDSAFSGRSDYQAFINNGIPSSGLFTGAEVVKTEEQEAIWGGTAGAQFDPCYHLVCDTIENLSHHALEVNSDAVAFAVMTYAYSTEDVNGVVGKPVPGKFEIPEPAGPEHTFAGPLGGDGPHDHDHDPVTE